MTKIRWMVIVLMATALWSPSPLLHAQIVEKAAAGVTTGIFLDQLFTKVSHLMTEARNAGDYLLARSALEALNAIDAWQKANSKILKDGLDQIDKTSKANFDRAQQLVDTANIDVAHRLETAAQITDNANQIIESIPLGSYQTYVLRYQPRIIPPNAGDHFIIRIRGVRLDKGDPQLKLSTGPAKRDLIGPQEVQFTVPMSELSVDPDALTRRSLKITYSTPKESWFARLFGQRDEVTRELPIIALPTKLATYQGQALRHFTKPDKRPYQSPEESFRGRHTNIPSLPIKPPAGWQWDLTQPLSLVPGQADNGHCSHIDLNASTQDGVVIVGHVDERGRTWQYPNGGDGWTNCALAGTIYRLIPDIETKVINGAIYWTKDEPISISADFVPDIQVNTFDKRSVKVTGTETDTFFTVHRNPDSLIIKPKVPEDLIN